MNFPLLHPDRLPEVVPRQDAIAQALRGFTDTRAADCQLERLLAACDQGLAALTPAASPEPPPTNWADDAPRGEREAAAYDDYFGLIRANDDARKVFAISILAALKELLTDARLGTTLTPLEWSLVRQGFVNLCYLVADDSPANSPGAHYP